MIRDGQNDLCDGASIGIIHKTILVKVNND